MHLLIFAHGFKRRCCLKGIFENDDGQNAAYTRRSRFTNAQFMLSELLNKIIVKFNSKISRHHGYCLRHLTNYTGKK